jgi:ferredoxin-NADP reductase
LIGWLYFIAGCITLIFGLALWFLLDGTSAMIVRLSLERQKKQSKKPIKLHVKNRIDHTNDLFSIELAPMGFKRLPKFMAGQFLTVRIPTIDNNGLEKIDTRRYSLARWHQYPKTYTLGIKAVNGGKVSNTLYHSLKAGTSVIEVLPPSGRFICHAKAKQIILIGAGIGITPMAAMLDQIISTSPSSQVSLFHTARDEDELLYKDHFLGLAKQHAWFNYTPFLTQPKKDWLGKIGRIQIQDILTNIQNLNECEIYMCAKLEMMQMIESALISSGMPATQIYWESFGNSTTHDEKQQYEVKITGGDTHIFDGEASLLHAIESWNIPIHADCRAGDCGECQISICSGEYKIVQPIAFQLPANKTLACCVIPRSELEIEI